MVLSFLRDRRLGSQLKLELEYELEHLPKPPKKGKTVEAYFQDMVAYVQRFCDRKIAFLPKFERNHGVVFSQGYRRRYLAKCFDALAEDLQKILLEYLEIDFIFFVQQAARSHGTDDDLESLEAFWSELEKGLLEKTHRLLSQWYDEPLRAHLEVIVQEGQIEPKRQEELRRLHQKNVQGLRERSERIIRRFCRHKDGQTARDQFRQVLTEQREQLPGFCQRLREQGFRVDPPPGAGAE
ncbi:hypothetical protein SAMN02746041_00200 [Desulfacinum hydrothermale DSM 13146]|uniref:Uncharacterized protein n=1 Tax=Desulfacinum hydrothermale DSM 13146 TaxID=1121390 RepID=A0A1W1X0N6_9BACT|nr:hypothetical protein [Desulfacinum hydrothermale]SMC16941.1 hypothetical protein SAMN02746041_00200 [Desulfacinum hydrothermale DSM 13146]